MLIVELFNSLANFRAHTKFSKGRVLGELLNVTISFNHKNILFFLFWFCGRFFGNC